VFAPISAILGLLFFTSTLPNGIRLGDLPGGGDSIEIVAGYTSGGLPGFASSPAARALELRAYAAGGETQLIQDIDRTALRFVVPKWAAPTLFDQIPSLFKDAGQRNEDVNAAGAATLDFRAKVEKEIQNALLGITVVSPNEATGNAFVLTSAPVPASVQGALAAIPKRGSPNSSDEQIARLPAERTLKFKSDLPSGGVIFAAPAPAVFYREWYLLLLLDRVIHRVVPLQVRTSLPLSVRTYYYRIELAVPPGQFPEPAQDNLMQELERLQFTPASVRDLAAARQDAVGYLNSKEVREWYASHDLSGRHDEGVQWLQSITADDLRAAARDLMLSNRVVATWSPKAKQTSVSAEPLNSAGQPPSAKAQNAGKSPVQPVAVEDQAVEFPPHVDAAMTFVPPERLASGVFLVRSSANAVFISGGALTRFDHDPTADDLKAFTKYRPERILVLAPAASLESARQLWAGFKGNAGGESGVAKGKVSSGDLPALYVLETMLNLRIIESGWWGEAAVRIDAGSGSDLQIDGDADHRAQILEWIKSIGMTPPFEKYFQWAREIAMHRLAAAAPDLQSLAWERDPQGTIQALATIAPQHVQDVARIYF
jgi:hypothetical protein